MFFGFANYVLQLSPTKATIDRPSLEMQLSGKFWAIYSNGSSRFSKHFWTHELSTGQEKEETASKYSSQCIQFTLSSAHTFCSQFCPIKNNFIQLQSTPGRACHVPCQNEGNREKGGVVAQLLCPRLSHNSLWHLSKLFIKLSMNFIFFASLN